MPGGSGPSWVRAGSVRTPAREVSVRAAGGPARIPALAAVTGTQQRMRHQRPNRMWRASGNSMRWGSARPAPLRRRNSRSILAGRPSHRTACSPVPRSAYADRVPWRRVAHRRSAARHCFVGAKRFPVRWYPGVRLRRLRWSWTGATRVRWRGHSGVRLESRGIRRSVPRIRGRAGRPGAAADLRRAQWSGAASDRRASGAPSAELRDGSVRPTGRPANPSLGWSSPRRRRRRPGQRNVAAGPAVGARTAVPSAVRPLPNAWESARIRTAAADSAAAARGSGRTTAAGPGPVVRPGRAIAHRPVPADVHAVAAVVRAHVSAAARAVAPAMSPRGWMSPVAQRSVAAAVMARGRTSPVAQGRVSAAVAAAVRGRGTALVAQGSVPGPVAAAVSTRPAVRKPVAVPGVGDMRGTRAAPASRSPIARQRVAARRSGPGRRSVRIRYAGTVPRTAHVPNSAAGRPAVGTGIPRTRGIPTRVRHRRPADSCRVSAAAAWVRTCEFHYCAGAPAGAARRRAARPTRADPRRTVAVSGRVPASVPARQPRPCPYAGTCASSCPTPAGRPICARTAGAGRCPPRCSSLAAGSLPEPHIRTG